MRANEEIIFVSFDCYSTPVGKASVLCLCYDLSLIVHNHQLAQYQISSSYSSLNTKIWIVLC